jgi:hypothetical protein
MMRRRVTSMGTTKKPLTIIVHPSLEATPEVAELAAKGHSLSLMDAATAEADLIISPTGWRMTGDLVKYLPLAVDAARAARYPKSPHEP